MRRRWRPMRSSSPDWIWRSLNQRKTPFSVPPSRTVSWSPSNLNTACSAATYWSLSSFTSPSFTARPTRVSSSVKT